MSIYLKNYWAIYREFIETFKEFTYKGIPISLLTNFYQHIDQDLKKKLESDAFSIPEKYELKKEEIQPYFEKWLSKIIPTDINKQKEGKILINYNYTRIPKNYYGSFLKSNNTVLLSRSKNAQILGIPNVTLQKYEESTEETASQLVKQATSLFGKLKDHPVFGNDFFQQTFLKRIPVIVTIISSCFSLFKQLNISTIIVGTTEDIVSRALAIVGSIYGVKSICLQHGILMGEEAFIPVFTSNVAVYGNYEENWYRQRGLAEERISRIGHPKYDEIFKKRNVIPTKISESQIPLLVITGPNIDSTRFKELIQCLTSHSNYELIIKPHPWEMAKKKLNFYLEMENIYPSVKVITSRDIDLYELIGQTDGIVSTLSTVALESLLFHKPVFLFNFLYRNREYDYFDQLGEYIQKDPKLLSKKIDQYYTNNEEKQAYHKMREEYLSGIYLDGNSGRKLLDFCDLN